MSSNDTIGKAECASDSAHTFRKKAEDAERLRRSHQAKTVSKLGRTITLLGGQAIIYVMFSSVPMFTEVFALVGDEKLLGLSFVFTVIMGFRIWFEESVTDDFSFVELDKQFKSEAPRSDVERYVNKIAQLVDVGVSAEAVREVVASKSAKLTKPVLSSNYIEHVQLIISGLDANIEYAEKKASRLLENGRNFVRWGIMLYVMSIILWQAYLYSIKFELHSGVVLGMISSTMIFIVMEVLGAWYLKQYRHYGDSAYSYIRVRSSYNRSLLAYCVVSELSGESKEDMLKVLSEPEGWPDLKEINANDFNYMLQSVESMGTIFDKMKGVFGNGKNKRRE